jgi:hypothetical protein
MAAVTATFIGNAVAPGGFQPIQFGGEDGLISEYWTMPGGTAADTIAITPRYVDDVRIAICSFSGFNNLSRTAANSSITITLGATAAAGTYEIMLIGRRQT